MKAIYHLMDAITWAQVENKENKNFVVFNRWIAVELHNGQKFKVFIQPIKNKDD